MSVKGRVAWITASAGGIGKACADAFCAAGAKLVICDINAEALAAAKADLEAKGAEVEAVVYNAGSAKETENVYKKAIERFGKVDILVNNAGIAGPVKPIYDLSVDEWDRTMEINMRSCFYTIKLAAQSMMAQNFGRIVNIASITAKNPIPDRATYVASKSGVLGVTRAAAMDLGKFNVTVNSISPSAIIGPRLEFVYQKKAEALGISYEACCDIERGKRPLRRFAAPEGVGQLALFLCDEELSNDITGQDFAINDGVRMD